jgi:phosphoglycerate dehydrogenase-like enzyme
MKILVIGKKGRLKHYTKDLSRLDKYDIVYAEPGSSDDDILEIGKDADFILVDAISVVSRKVIEAMPNLKMIHSEGVAFNKIDIEAAKEKGVYVCNCKGMNATAVAEQAILLMLGLLRGVCTGDKAVREGRQMKVKESYMINGSLKELRDCTIGFVGFGDIAKAAAKMANVFGSKVVYYDVFRANEEVEKAYDVTYMELNDLLAVSDIVSLHLPVTSETTHMANAEFFANMKDGSYFINTARGELVDDEALLEAIRCGHVAGAGLDTVTGEPITTDNVMLQAEEEVESKIIYSCHVGGITASSFARGYEMFWSDLDLVAEGKRPEHIVNKL